VSYMCQDLVKVEINIARSELFEQFIKN